VQVQERFWPLGLPRPAVECSNKGVMEVGNGGNVPGIAGQGACKETALVIDEMVNDHFNNLLGKFEFGGSRGNLCRSATGKPLDLG